MNSQKKPLNALTDKGNDASHTGVGKAKFGNICHHIKAVPNNVQHIIRNKSSLEDLLIHISLTLHQIDCPISKPHAGMLIASISDYLASIRRWPFCAVSDVIPKDAATDSCVK
jgi:hypothetical protein